MSGVRKTPAIESLAESFPNHADLFRDGTIPSLHWFPTRSNSWFFAQIACVFCRLTHSVPVTHEASRYGLLLPSRQDTRP